MPEIDVIQRSLQELESELSAFKTAKNLLDEVKQNADANFERWEEIQATDVEHKAELFEIIKQSQASFASLVEKTIPLIDRLAILAKAVDEAGFPQRLDLLQTNTANAVSAIQSIQSRLDLLEVNLGNSVKLAAQTGVSEIRQHATQDKKDLSAMVERILTSQVATTNEIKEQSAKENETLLKKMKWFLAILIGIAMIQFGGIATVIWWMMIR